MTWNASRRSTTTRERKTIISGPFQANNNYTSREKASQEVINHSVLLAGNSRALCVFCSAPPAIGAVFLPGFSGNAVVACNKIPLENSTNFFPTG